MATLNMLVQFAGVCVGIYLIFSRTLAAGIGLIAVIAVGHFLFTQLSNLLLLAHQKTMPPEQVQELLLNARFGVAETPVAWKAIAMACGVSYFAVAVSAIWLFLAP